MNRATFSIDGVEVRPATFDVWCEAERRLLEVGFENEADAVSAAWAHAPVCPAKFATRPQTAAVGEDGTPATTTPAPVVAGTIAPRSLS